MIEELSKLLKARTELDKYKVKRHLEELPAFLLSPFLWAFPTNMRKRIYARDDGRSVLSGRGMKERDGGWMVHIAHYPGREGDNRYNAGRTITVDEHIHEHIQLHLKKQSQWSFESLRLLSSLAWEEGLHAWWYQDENPMIINEDRTMMLAIFDEYNLNIEDFLEPELWMEIDQLKDVTTQTAFGL